MLFGWQKGHLALSSSSALTKAPHDVLCLSVVSYNSTKQWAQSFIVTYIYIGYGFTQTHCYNPVAPAYLIWAYCAHGRQRRCQEDPVGLPCGRLEKTTGSSPHHMAQHHPTGSETSPSYAPQSSRFGSEPPSVEDDVDVWRYAIVSCMPETTTTTDLSLHTMECCSGLFGIMLILLVINISSSSPAISSTQWRQILAQSRDICLPHLHSTPR